MNGKAVNAPVFSFRKKLLELLGGYRTNEGTREYVEEGPVKTVADKKVDEFWRKSMLSFEEKGILEYEGKRGRKNGKCKQFVNKMRKVAFFGKK